MVILPFQQDKMINAKKAELRIAGLVLKDERWERSKR